MKNVDVAKRSSGSVIRKNIISNYSGAVLYGLLFNVALMIDSIIAGLSLGSSGIAAVALGCRGMVVWQRAYMRLSMAAGFG